ncbi:Amidase [Penicillium robsamsonii]|uniref:Amidase n=1 Tax=Penicillium robsamsonii TaxID=1792511 RepID=UPI00254722F6|nr:Amidase [Penicillium robsamsonii]KAJ5813140.1 Amidase [Penicillium robsamsonii]
MTATPSYEERCAAKRAQQLSSIPPEWRLKHVPSAESVPDALNYIRGLLTPHELALTEVTNITVHLQDLASGKLTSEELTKAFAKRAAFAHQLTTCCTEIFFEAAFATARALDEHLAKTGSPVGPLHGLPVSVKDSLRVKGVDTSVGWVALTNKPSEVDGKETRALRRLGAVLYTKTNVPQSLMMSDSYNHVFGQCVNSLNRRLISGGSSGGESSLISSKGSILGIGTDIGGSVRIPASLCGIYGLCPSVGRQPFDRQGMSSARQDLVRPVAGPMATSLETIEIYMKSLQKASAWEFDPEQVPLPWGLRRPSTQGNHFKIGFVLDDGVVKVQPPIARAIREVVEALRAGGHEVFEWDASSHKNAYKLWEKCILSGGGETCRKMCEMSGEPLIEGMLVGTPSDLLTTAQTHQLVSEKYDFESMYLERWTESNVDAVIMPVTPWVGYSPRTWVKSHQYVGYTSIWNFLDYAALAMPVTTATKSEDAPILHQDWMQHTPRNKSDSFNHAQYDINLVEGMPVGMQVVGGRFGEEKCIYVARAIEQALEKHGKRRV